MSYSKEDLETSILSHIEDIDHKIRQSATLSTIAELQKAKSTALLALAKLVERE